MDDPKDGSDGSAPAFPPIDITVRLWLDAEPEVFSPLSNWLTADVLQRAADTQADLDAAKGDDETMEVDIEEGDEDE